MARRRQTDDVSDGNNESMGHWTDPKRTPGMLGMHQGDVSVYVQSSEYDEYMLNSDVQRRCGGMTRRSSLSVGDGHKSKPVGGAQSTREKRGMPATSLCSDLRRSIFVTLAYHPPSLTITKALIHQRTPPVLFLLILQLLHASDGPTCLLPIHRKGRHQARKVSCPPPLHIPLARLPCRPTQAANLADVDGTSQPPSQTITQRPPL